MRLQDLTEEMVEDYKEEQKKEWVDAIFENQENFEEFLYDWGVLDNEKVSEKLFNCVSSCQQLSAEALAGTIRVVAEDIWEKWVSDTLDYDVLLRG